MDSQTARMPANTLAFKSEGSVYVIQGARYNSTTRRLIMSLKAVGGAGETNQELVISGDYLKNRDIDAAQFAKDLVTTGVGFDCLRTQKDKSGGSELNFCTEFEITYITDRVHQ